MSYGIVTGQLPADSKDDPLIARRRQPNPVPFVGSMGIKFNELWGKWADDNCETWFKGARVNYVHTARTAIQRICSLINLRPGDEVLVPAYNCGAEVDALLQSGATVRLFRVSRSAELDLDDLRSRTTHATKAVFVIYYFGFPQPLASLADFCRSKGLCLIEDCALSTLTEFYGRRIGQLGDMAIYNFPKVLPVPDGGALVINNPGLKDTAWPLQRPGFADVMSNTLRIVRQSLLRGLPGPSARLLYSLLRTGVEDKAGTCCGGRREMPQSCYFNPALSHREMSRFSAALLKRINFSEVRLRRRQNFLQLLRCLSQVPGVVPLYRELPEGVCPLSFPILVEKARQMMNRLCALSIPAIAWWSGYHRRCFEWDGFPEACYLKDHVVALPIHQHLDGAAVEYIASQVRECLASA